ncbi:hypothetical protein ACI65C_010538 [Semiaphis heraclei]
MEETRARRIDHPIPSARAMFIRCDGEDRVGNQTLSLSAALLASVSALYCGNLVSGDRRGTCIYYLPRFRRFRVFHGRFYDSK